MCNTTQQSWRSWSISFMYNCTPIFRPLTLYDPLPHPALLHRGPRCTAVKHVKQLYMGSITLVEIAYVIHIVFHLFLPQTWLPYPQSPYLTTHDLFAYKFMLCKSSETDKSYLLHIFFLRCILTGMTEHKMTTSMPLLVTTRGCQSSLRDFLWRQFKPDQCSTAQAMPDT